MEKISSTFKEFTVQPSLKLRLTSKEKTLASGSRSMASSGIRLFHISNQKDSCCPSILDSCLLLL